MIISYKRHHAPSGGGGGAAYYIINSGGGDGKGHPWTQQAVMRMRILSSVQGR